MFPIFVIFFKGSRVFLVSESICLFCIIIFCAFFDNKRTNLGSVTFIVIELCPFILLQAGASSVSIGTLSPFFLWKYYIDFQLTFNCTSMVYLNHFCLFVYFCYPEEVVCLIWYILFVFLWSLYVSLPNHLEITNKMHLKIPSIICIFFFWLYMLWMMENGLKIPEFLNLFFQMYVKCSIKFDIVLNCTKTCIFQHKKLASGNLLWSDQLCSQETFVCIFSFHEEGDGQVVPGSPYTPSSLPFTCRNISIISPLSMPLVLFVPFPFLPCFQSPVQDFPYSCQTPILWWYTLLL